MGKRKFTYEEGRIHRKVGKSIHFNPYRNVLSDGRYGEWQEGWEYQNECMKKEARTITRTPKTLEDLSRLYRRHG